MRDDHEDTLPTKPIPKIKDELDKLPDKPSATDSKDSSKLSQGERNWLRWLKNFGFIKVVLFLMGGVYLTDIILSVCFPDVEVSMQEPFFEVLRAILFTAAGYVFAKLKK